MKFHRLLVLLMGLKIFLGGMPAHGSYVVEAEGVSASSGTMSTGVDFDFVAHDFGMEPKDAIQILLENLSSATNLHGNLLSWSFGEDYSYYDEDVTDDDPVSNVLSAEAANDQGFATTGEALPAGLQIFSPLNTNAIFWILGPSEFASFSQLTAARFGFDRGR